MKENDRKNLDKIRQFYADNGILPTYSEMKDLIGFSKHGCYKFAQRMIKLNRLKKIGRRIAPGELLFVD